MEELSVTEFDRDIGTLELPSLKFLGPEALVSEAISYFVENRAGMIGVGAEGKLSGIITEWDLVHSFRPDIDSRDVKLDEIRVENPITLYSENTLYEALKTMAKRSFPSFPVCDDDGTVNKLFDIKIVFNFLTENFKPFLDDIGTQEVWDPTKALQAFSEDYSYSETMKDDSSLHQNYFLTTFNRIPSRPIMKIDQKAKLGDAWEMLCENRLENVVVTSFGTKLEGILTLKDLIKNVLIKKGEVDLRSPISNFMTKNPHSLLYKHPLAFGVNQFQKYGYNHMVIVDEDRIPVKVISLLDIITHLTTKIKLN